MHEVRDNNKQESFAVLDLAADQRSKPVALLLGQANRYERVKGRFSLHRYEDVSGDSSRGLRARKAATISGKAPARLLPVLDCKKMFSSSRKTRQRNPSHFGSYIHSLPIGKHFTARGFIGVIGGLKNLSIELFEVPTRSAIYFLLA